jgi:predicted  nucleic acid-binding Zn-ribbon protein
MTARDSAKAADLDAEIAAEQEYLRKLTGGELTVADLDGEIDRTMDKIRKLQKRRGDLGSAAPSAAPASTYTPTGNWPAGSREAKWEEELSQLQGELGRLKSQQSATSGASDREREALDERVGETQYRIQKLEAKLKRAGQP